MSAGTSGSGTGGPDIRPGRITALNTSVAPRAQLYDYWLGAIDASSLFRQLR